MKSLAFTAALAAFFVFVRLATAAPPAETAKLKVEPSGTVAAPAPATEESPSEQSEGNAETASDAVAFKKMTGDQVYHILRERERQRTGGDVAVIVPVATTLFLLLAIAFGLLSGVLKERQRHATLRAAIEKGVSIPPELILPPARKHADLRRGIVLVASGLGLAFFLSIVSHERGVWMVGLIPALIGAGFLLVWKIVRREESSGTPVRDVPR